MNDITRSAPGGVDTADQRRGRRGVSSVSSANLNGNAANG